MLSHLPQQYVILFENLQHRTTVPRPALAHYLVVSEEFMAAKHKMTSHGSLTAVNNPGGWQNM